MKLQEKSVVASWTLDSRFLPTPEFDESIKCGLMNFDDIDVCSAVGHILCEKLKSSKLTAHEVLEWYKEHSKEVMSKAVKMVKEKDKATQIKEPPVVEDEPIKSIKNAKKNGVVKAQKKSD